MRNLWITCLLVFAAPALLQTAGAQETDAAARAAAEKAREAAELRVENDMVKMKNLVDALSRNLGQLHFLRTLCFGEGDQKWRDLASKMMTIEAGDDSARKRQLVGAFNAGYYLQEERFEVCSKDVSVDAAALAENGRHLASMLGDPYRER
ncbi:MAG: TIGR02301 family protein [Alphaproteobacteria bacterium]